VADSLHETALLVGQRRHPLALYLRQQLVQPGLVGGPLFLIALGLGLAATLQPALEPALAAPRWGGRHLVALQTGVALREVVAEQSVLAAGLQNDPLLPARDVDEEGQKGGKRI